jgi:putative peptidoglycan lipid II flippase
MELSLLLLSPIAVFCLMLSHSIIRLVFQRGQFTPGATDLMAMIFYYYSFSLFSFAFLRLLNTYLFARRDPGAYFRLSFLHYGLVLVFDLFYVGVLHMGAKGIPLGFLTGATLACGLAIRRDLGGMRASLDPALDRFAVKDILGALGAALTVWGLRAWMTPPLTTSQDFVYLCIICGAGSIMYLCVLALLRALPVTQLAALWPRTNG